MTVRAIRIGLTGPIGCGKSTIAGWLGELPGTVVIDADRIAHDVLAAGAPEVEAVYRRFGAALQLTDGSLDRAALGRIVFDDRDALRDLERIVHPGVRTRILARLDEADAAAANAVVVEAIKLVEGGLVDLCDEVWLVTCEASAQRSRLAARGMDASDAAARVTAQGDLAARLVDRATRVIDTTGDPEPTRSAVERLLVEALRERGP
jgi:dephospho-CoA kinase